MRIAVIPQRWSARPGYAIANVRYGGGKSQTATTGNGLKESIQVKNPMTGYALGFNRSKQHLKFCMSRRSVADEETTKNLLFG
jgi:hypothetical protein